MAEAAEKAAFNSSGLEAETIELPAGTYTLTKGPLRVVHEFSTEHEPYPLTIVGLGARANEVVITAGGKSRVLVDGRGGGSTGLVVLKRLEITGGNGEGGIQEEPLEPEKGEGGGIAIEQNGTLKLDEVLLTGNTAAIEGGGIEDVGELTVENSTIAHNTVTGGRGLGGGISSDNLNNESHESIKVVNSTLAFNSVSGGSQNEGSAIFNGTVLELTNSTLSGNSAPSSGGALAGFNNGAAPNMGVSTIANNVIAYNKGGGCAGKLPTSLGGNDVPDPGCELAGQHATGDISEDPGLEKDLAEPKLAENGGATETIAIGSSLAPSAKDGLEQYCPATDQRGTARPSHADCSSGAYQYVTAARVTITAATATAETAVSAKSSAGDASCTATSCTVNEGDAVTLTAESKNPGLQFTGWSGGLCATQNPCKLEHVKAAETDTANFNGAKEVSVYGDLNPSTWQAEREPSNPTRFAGQTQGLLLNGSTEMSFQQVTFQGRAAFSSGASAYGVRMIDGSHATFAEVHVEAGSGANGARGANGAQGAAGTNGEHGQAGATPAGPARAAKGVRASRSRAAARWNSALACSRKSRGRVKAENPAAKVAGRRAPAAAGPTSRALRAARSMPRSRFSSHRLSRFPKA